MILFSFVGVCSLVLLERKTKRKEKKNGKKKEKKRR